MHFFFLGSIAALIALSFYFSTWTSSVICSLLIVLIIWTRLFSDRIIKKSFSNLINLKETELHHLSKIIDDAFTKDTDNKKPSVYIDLSSQNLQMYCFGSTAAPQIITSKQTLRELSKKDLILLIEQAGQLHQKQSFFNKQGLVALFLYIGSLGRITDTILSFVLGIKTKKGEPKALVRKPLFFVLSKLNFLFKLGKSEHSFILRNYSYLNKNHSNPVLSPISISDISL
jgi:hypothetical protein